MTTLTPYPELLQRLEALRLELGKHRSDWLINKTADRELRADMCSQIALAMDQMLKAERNIELLHTWDTYGKDS
jgi:hypothetical protein